jgi:hypothetical protein
VGRRASPDFIGDAHQANPTDVGGWEVVSAMELNECTVYGALAMTAIAASIL